MVRACEVEKECRMASQNMWEIVFVPESSDRQLVLELGQALQSAVVILSLILLENNILFVVAWVLLAVQVHLLADRSMLVAALVLAEAQVRAKDDSKALDVEMAAVLAPHEPYHLIVECIGCKTLMVLHFGLAWELLPLALGAGKELLLLAVLEHYLI